VKRKTVRVKLSARQPVAGGWGRKWERVVDFVVCFRNKRLCRSVRPAVVVDGLVDAATSRSGDESPRVRDQGWMSSRSKGDVDIVRRGGLVGCDCYYPGPLGSCVR
jgi:hypothetical protein